MKPKKITEKNNCIIKALCINIFYLIFLLILFKPHFYYDDFLMACRSYGVYTGEYSYDVTYMNFLYGRLIRGLMNIAGFIPWYTVLFYVWTFVALVFFSSVFLRKNKNFFGYFVVNCFVLFFAYEGYIDITFTKVAGITGAIGAFLVLYKHSSRLEKTLGEGLFLGACLIRYMMAQMVLYAFILLVLFECIRVIIVKQDRNRIKRYIVALISLCIIFKGVTFIPYTFSEDEKSFWKEYWKYNDIRSGIQDFEIPNYDENKSFYEKLDLSKNDIYIYRAWNADVEKISYEKGEKIWALQEEQGLLFNASMEKIFAFRNIMKYFKVFPLQLLNIDVFVLYLVVVIWVYMFVDIDTLKKVYYIFNSLIVLLGINYYMYIGNRYLQHRVDIGVIAVAVLSLLLFIGEEDYKPMGVKSRRTVVILSALLVIFCGKYHMGNNDVAQREVNNREFFEMTSKTDKKYLVVAEREDGNCDIVTFLEPFDVPQIGIWKNVFFENSFYEKERFKKYGISNIYKDIIDNEEMYMVMAKSNSDIEHWEEYLTSNYSEDEVKITPIREFGNKKLCTVSTCTLKEKLTQAKDKESTDVISDISCEIGKTKIKLTGRAYLKGESGFDEEMYLQYIDSQSGKEEIENIVLKNDNTKEVGAAGSCGWISYNQELPDFYDTSDTINLVLVENGTKYTIPVDKNMKAGN